jgi:hypothetical protein
MEEHMFSKREEEKRQLFLELGITSEDLSKFLNDPKRFPPETWAFLQKKKEELEEQIDKKIREMSPPPHQKTGKPPYWP